MDGVSSASAVVSLAIQLLETVQEIRDFLRSVHHAPSELIKLVETLEQLHGTLNQVRHLLEQQYSILRLPGSPVFMESALQNCNRKIITLEKVVNEAKVSLGWQNRVKRTWAAMKLAYKKEDMQEMQTQLLHAETGLQTAMLSNSWQLQMHHITIASSSVHQAVAIEESSLMLPTVAGSQHDRASSPSSYTSKNSILSSTKETYYNWYQGLFGFIVVRTKSKSLKRSDSRWNDNRAVVNEKTIKIKPSFMRQVLELQLVNSFGRISRTLSTYHVLEWNAPIFKMCKDGDLEGLQVAMSSGGISPFVVDEYGETLLHRAANYRHPKLCDYLLQIGIDPNHRCDYGSKAIAMVGLSGLGFRAGRIFVDTLRLLIPKQDEMSSSDLDVFWNRYEGPVEGAEFIFNQYLTQYEEPSTEVLFLPLATALREFGRRRPRWGGFLRLLIRRGASLHAPVRNTGSSLDKLFWYTGTPYEGEQVAQRWLQILSSEGCDILAYLKEEFELRGANMQLIHPAWEYLPRQLNFDWGSSPCVSWDWWIDPDSPVSLVREVFKQMTLPSPSYQEWRGWEAYWPFGYSASHSVYTNLDGRGKLYDCAQERFNRRTKKRFNQLARAQGSRAPSKIPGAWPV